MVAIAGGMPGSRVAGAVAEDGPERGQNFHVSQPSSASNRTGAAQMRASWSSRQASRRLPTAPNINPSAAVSTKLLRDLRHCHHQISKPARKALTCKIIWAV